MARIFNAVRAENTPPRHARGDFKQALRICIYNRGMLDIHGFLLSDQEIFRRHPDGWQEKST
jgi:hypothetical protein